MFQQLRTATWLLLALTVLTGGIYPLVVTAVAQVAFPRQANGSLIQSWRAECRIGTHRAAVSRRPNTSGAGSRRPARRPTTPRRRAARTTARCTLP